MKEIKITDENYDKLAELVNELQTQENDSQAFPYFWVPRSTKKTIGTEDDTPIVYDEQNCTTLTLKELAEEEGERELFLSFLEYEELPSDTAYDSEEVSKYMWQLFVDEDPDYRIVYEREDQESDQNPSLFKSDVKNYIKNNKHHLGENPHTYANTVQRMPKMSSLIEILYKIIQPDDMESVNHEALRFVRKK